MSEVAKDGQEYLSLQNLIIEEEGLVQVFVANESEVDVWFDDLKIVHSPALIVQENHYYPFGLNIVGLEKQGQPDHKFQYNGKEKQEEFGLGLHDYDVRQMDNQIGRFWQVDPLADMEQEFWSPYHYTYDNPINYVDPEGLMPENVTFDSYYKERYTSESSSNGYAICPTCPKDPKYDPYRNAKQLFTYNNECGCVLNGDGNGAVINGKRSYRDTETDEHWRAMLFRSFSGYASTAATPLKEAFNRANIYSPGTRMNMKTKTIIFEKKIKVPFFKKPLIRIHQPLFEMTGKQTRVWSKRLNVAGKAFGGLAMGLTVVDMKNNGITSSNSLDLVMAGMATTGVGTGIAGGYFFLNTISILTTGKDIGQHIDGVSENFTGKSLSDNVKDLIIKK